MDANRKQPQFPAKSPEIVKTPSSTPLPGAPAPLDDTQPMQPVAHSARPAYRRWWTVAILLWLLVVGGIAIVLWPDEAKPVYSVVVTLQLGEQTYPVTTETHTVGEFLLEQNLTIEAGDILTPEVDTAITPGLVIRIDRAHTVALTVDGATSVLRTTLTGPINILNLAGQTVNPADRILVNGTQVNAADLPTWSSPINTLEIRRAVAVQIVDGETRLDWETTGATVSDVLFEAGIQLFLADIVTPDLSASVVPAMVIAIDRARPLTIIVDGMSMETRVKGVTVAEALAEIGITLSGLDYTIPAETIAILPGLTVRVIRVTEAIITDQELIPYETVYQADNTLDLDRRSIIQSGQNGVLERTTRVRYENGIEISRVIEQELVIQSPQNQIIGYGTNIVIRTLDTPEGPQQYWRRLRMYATSYYPAELGGSTTTSIGYHLQKGIVGIDPHIIPYRTNLYVAGYGVGVAADTGGPRSTPYWIDLGYSDADYVPWSQWVDVYLLVPVPETVNYLLPENERGGPIP